MWEFSCSKVEGTKQTTQRVTNLVPSSIALKTANPAPVILTDETLHVGASPIFLKWGFALWASVRLSLTQVAQSIPLQLRSILFRALDTFMPQTSTRGTNVTLAQTASHF